MADTKISNLAAVTDVQATDEFVLARAGATKKLTGASLVGAVGLFNAYAYVRHELAANTAGGTATSGSWLTLPINTEVFDPDGLLTISSNQLTIGAGTYLVQARAPFFRTGAARLRVQDITNTATLGLGAVAYSNNGANDSGGAHVTARFTLAGSTVIELQYRVEFTKATDGLGTVSNWSVVEVYGELELWREA